VPPTPCSTKRLWRAPSRPECGDLAFGARGSGARHRRGPGARGQIFTDTQQRSAEHLIEAQERATALIAEAESTASQIDHDARLAAERLIDSAKVNGDALVERGREQGRAIVEQAHEARKTVLNDLAVKRKALHLQIDQLRAARDTLSTFVHSVRESIDAVIDGLNSSDDAARHAALEALRLRPPSREPTEEELLEGTPLREVPAPALASGPATWTRIFLRCPTPRRSRRVSPRSPTASRPTCPRPSSRMTPRVLTWSTRSLRDCARRLSKSVARP